MHGVIPRTPPRSKVLTINKDATTPNLLRVTIVNMSNLRLKKSDKDKVNPMVQIQFEGETFKTRQYTDSRFPTYEQSFLFMLPSHPKKARKGVSKSDVVTDDWRKLPGSLRIQAKHRITHSGLPTLYKPLGERTVVLQDIFDGLVDEKNGTWKDTVVTKHLKLLHGSGTGQGSPFFENEVQLRFHIFAEEDHDEIDFTNFAQGLSDSEDDEEVEDPSSWNWCDDDGPSRMSKKTEKNLDETESLTEAEREIDAALEAEQEAIEEAVRKITVLDGAFQLTVHIIEVRDLRPHHDGGYANPVCEVRAYGQSQSTSIQKKQHRLCSMKCFPLSSRICLGHN